MAAKWALNGRHLTAPHKFFSFFFSAHPAIFVVRPFKMIKIANNFCARNEKVGAPRPPMCEGVWGSPNRSVSLTNQKVTAEILENLKRHKTGILNAPSTTKLELKVSVRPFRPFEVQLTLRPESTCD